MARSYGNHFNNNTVPGVTTLGGTLAYDPGRKIGAGEGHARTRSKIMRATVGTIGMTSGDELRMGQFRSSDRILEIFVSGDTGSTTYAANLGLYKSGSNHDGAVIDADLFASAIAFGAGAIARIDGFVESAVLGNMDRGKTLWELAHIGDGTYTADPMENWDLVLTSTANGTTAVESILIEVVYTSGD